ncbi:sugar phosphate isomerase/epimerase family protein [Paenibacillus protaetiae]|uniref:Sugar phosphate isomerase/epimerase n=1 Tax=Paenibacillus protaetiae TaxID=2509456 RepID=A0A4P6EX07_9BACL|nr:sugar phosphate isomerase/epimerase [Paenibacillus protaetiae]QAY67930.1 sugar phosphate isomerase/epimerase [Paenibacillus protaetiae]
MILGAQLYTVRAYLQTEKDIRRTLQKIAEMGYTSVQVSAMGSIQPATLRAICDELSLQIALTHTNADRIVNETEKVIEEHDILGCNYIGIGAMPDKYRGLDWYGYFAHDFREAAGKIAKAGKLFMYHNHNFEFEKIGGKRLIERLIEDFSPEEMGITLDTYWVQAAGADVCEWIGKLKDRLHCVHLKDMEVRGTAQLMAPVMEGNMNFPAIMKALEQTNAKYALVEQDVCQTSPFECLQTSYNNLAALGYR